MFYLLCPLVCMYVCIAFCLLSTWSIISVPFESVQFEEFWQIYTLAISLLQQNYKTYLSPSRYPTAMALDKCWFAFCHCNLHFMELCIYISISLYLPVIYLYMQIESHSMFSLDMASFTLHNDFEIHFSACISSFCFLSSIWSICCTGVSYIYSSVHKLLDIWVVNQFLAVVNKIANEHSFTSLCVDIWQTTQ